MLSVLIPTYNYNIVTLVNSLHEQLTNAAIEFEIICLDDCSNKQYIDSNQIINELSNTKYLLSKTNNGIAINRQLLVDKAIYDWIILIDADVELGDTNYISNYLSAIKTGNEIIFGGILYKNIKPKKDAILRWKYGKLYEELSAEKRNIHPYKITSAANLCIKKDIYKQFGLDYVGDSYGMDIFFGPQLKLNKIPVLHINNGVYHLGLEKSQKYLLKTEFAVNTLSKLYSQNKIEEHDNDLLKTFILSKRLKLNYFFSWLFKIFNRSIKKNLLSGSPIIILLQFYKISYMCYKDLN